MALLHRWLTLWQKLNAHGDPYEVYTGLVQSYSETHRFYHTLTHIAHCLTDYAQAAHLPWISSPLEIEAALWFHDEVYCPLAQSNEAKSAEKADSYLAQMGLPVQFRRTVSDLILITRHTSPPQTFDEKLMVDIDLSILGQPRTTFQRYEQAIRKEYGRMRESAFRNGRVRILHGFLDRESVYHTQFFQDRYEEQARKNLRWSLRQLAEAKERTNAPP